MCSARAVAAVLFHYRRVLGVDCSNSYDRCWQRHSKARGPPTRDEEDCIGGGRTDVMANGAPRADIRYHHWNAFLHFHCTRHRTTLGTDGAKGAVGKTKPSLDDRDFRYRLRGRGRRRSAHRIVFFRSWRVIRRCAEGAPDNREQMASGKAGAHGIVAVDS